MTSQKTVAEWTPAVPLRPPTKSRDIKNAGSEVWAANIPSSAVVEPRLGAAELTATLAEEAEEVYTVNKMQPLKARVHNGRLVLDEPTELPEGEVVELVPLDAILDDEFDDEERAQLRQALDEGIEQMKAGQTIDLAEAMAELRAHR
jgi:hypothetical protein